MVLYKLSSNNNNNNKYLGISYRISSLQDKLYIWVFPIEWRHRNISYIFGYSYRMASLRDELYIWVFPIEWRHWEISCIFGYSLLNASLELLYIWVFLSNGVTVRYVIYLGIPYRMESLQDKLYIWVYPIEWCHCEISYIVGYPLSKGVTTR